MDGHDIPTKTIKEVLLRDDILTETEGRVSSTAARPRCSWRVDTTGQLLHSMDDVVKGDLRLGAWVWPVPTVPLRQLGNSSLKVLELNGYIWHS